MLRRTLVIGLVLVSLVTLHCTRQESSPADDAYKQLRATLGELESADEKLVLIEDFLDTYPDDTHAAGLVRTAIYFRGQQLEDPAGAKAFAEQALANIKDPEDRFEIGLELHRLALELNQPSPLREVAAELAAAKELNYVNHLDLLEAAVNIPDWELVLEHADAAIAFATPETFRADYPDSDFSEQTVKNAVTRRRCNSLAYKAGALLNLDRLEEALPVFAEAESFNTFSYAGVPETPLYRFWGEAELKQGNLERAVELLAPDAVMGRDETALAGLRRAYTEQNGNQDGFDDYLWSVRNQLAKKVDDFSLATYDGEMVSLSGLAGKVVLLNFWNPG